MLIYRFESIDCCPVQGTLVIADNENEALNIVIKETKIQEWGLQDQYPFKKGILFYGDADC